MSWWKKRYECGCGSVIEDKSSTINNHNKTRKHQDFLLLGVPCKQRHSKTKTITADLDKIDLTTIKENIILQYNICTEEK
jgi:hypothetical protein